MHFYGRSQTLLVLKTKRVVQVEDSITRSVQAGTAPWSDALDFLLPGLFPRSHSGSLLCHSQITPIRKSRPGEWSQQEFVPKVDKQVGETGEP